MLDKIRRFGLRTLTMKYFGISRKPTGLLDESIFPMPNVHWGPGPAPYGAELIGGYPDSTGAAALLKLNSGQYAGGNGGMFSMIDQKLTPTPCVFMPLWV